MYISDLSANCLVISEGEASESTQISLFTDVALPRFWLNRFLSFSSKSSVFIWIVVNSGVITAVDIRWLFAEPIRLSSVIL